MRTDSRELLAVGIFGRKSRVGERIEILLRRGRAFSPRISGIGVATGALVLCSLLLAASFTPRWIAFAQQSQLSFEVASIKPSHAPTANGGLRFDPGRITAENVSLRFLIIWAYKVKPFQVSGGPGWVDSARYDIAAKAEGNASPDQLRPMLQTLLGERFHLKLRHETKEQPVYALSAAKTGMKLRESQANCSAPARKDSADPPRNSCGGWPESDREITGTKISTGQFAEALANHLDRLVVNKTGFAGNFDVQLKWTGDGTADDADALSVFTALQEQLGLKLESQKGPVDILVIDQAEKPDAN